MSELAKDIRKVAQCVYLACDSDVASDIAVKCKKIADSHDKLTEQVKMLREALELVSDIIPMGQNANGGGYMLVLSNDDCRIIKETLSISEL